MYMENKIEMLIRIRRDRIQSEINECERIIKENSKIIEAMNNGTYIYD